MIFIYFAKYNFFNYQKIGDTFGKIMKINTKEKIYINIFYDKI